MEKPFRSSPLVLAAAILLTAFLPKTLKAAAFAVPTPIGADSATQLKAETTLSFSSGATFIVPAGWFVATKGDSYLLQDPDRQLSFVMAERKDAFGLDAIQATWKSYWPDFSQAIIRTKDTPDERWEEVIRPFYFVADPTDPTKSDLNRSLGAYADKKKGVWYVALWDGAIAASDRRLAQLNTILGTLRPKGEDDKTAALPWDAQKEKDLEDFIDEGRGRCRIPGVAVAVVQGGKILYEKGFGVRESGKNIPVTPHTLFAVASITKSLTTLLMARLVDEGKLDWDTPVTQFLPDFQLADPQLTRQLTLKYTVCACTGLPRQDMDLVFPAQEDTPDAMLAKMAKIRPTTGFGETFQYSNQMVAVGGYMATRAVDAQDDLNTAYAKLLQSDVFDPLGMKDSCVDLKDVMQRDFAAPHGMDLELNYVPIPFTYEAWMNPILPAAGAWCSADDMAQYVLMELAKGVAPDGTRIVSEKNLLKRREPEARMSAGSSYGLGQIVSNIDGVTVVGHGGAASGYTTDYCFLPGQDSGLVVLTNGRDADVFTGAVRNRFLELLTGKKPHAQENLETWDANRKESNEKMMKYYGGFRGTSWLSDYAGSYVNEDLGRVSIGVEDEGAMFDEGKWKVPMGAYYDRNGEVRFMLTKPPLTWSDFILKEDSDGHKTLTYKTPQKDYVFEWLGK